MWWKSKWGIYNHSEVSKLRTLKFKIQVENLLQVFVKILLLSSIVLLTDVISNFSSLCFP